MEVQRYKIFDEGGRSVAFVRSQSPEQAVGAYVEKCDAKALSLIPSRKLTDEERLKLGKFTATKTADDDQQLDILDNKSGGEEK